MVYMHEVLRGCLRFVNPKIISEGKWIGGEAKGANYIVAGGN